ncbi:MAG: BtpA/SgcQ family protein [Anaerolineae bacterium]
MLWLTDLFHVTKPIIAMCHLKALPGDPGYDPHGGMAAVVEAARADLLALQTGGVDAIMFSNEASLPYLTKVETITAACMVRVIAELRPLITVPFGVNVLWDPAASIDVAVATGAQFVREIFTGVYASDYGMWNTNCGEVIRHQHTVHGQSVKLLFNIVPESAVYMSERNIVDIAKSTVFVSHPDGLCVSGITAGSETSLETLKQVKAAVPETAVFANTGVRVSNVVETLSIVDGAVVGTAFKQDGYIWNPVDEGRVHAFMTTVKAMRL